MDTLIPVLLAHFIAECVLANRGKAGSTWRARLWYHLRHGLVVFGSMVVALVMQTSNLMMAVYASGLVAVLHLLVDRLRHLEVAKLKVLKRSLRCLFGSVDGGIYLIIVSVVAQLCHVVTVWGITGLLWRSYYPLDNLWGYLEGQGQVTVPNGERVPYIVLILLIGGFGFSKVITLILKHSLGLPEVTTTESESKEPESTGTVPNPGTPVAMAAAASMPGASAGPNNGTVKPRRKRQRKERPVGRWIGIIERMMIILLVAAGASEGVGFIVAAKSLSRFKQLENKEFAEYYIAGTLISSFIGISFGLLLKYIH